MFTYSIVKAKRSHYTVQNGALYVYYDNESELGASLDILVDPKESKDSEASNNFVSLTFTYHNKSSNPHTVLFSIMKSDKDTLIVRLTNNWDKFILLNVQKAMALMSDFAKQTTDAIFLRVEGDQYLSDENLMSQSKKLLENFTTVVKGLLCSPEPEKSVLIILNLLKFEASEFTNTISINKISHGS